MAVIRGWLDWAERVPGDHRKQNGGENPVNGIVAHSAEGFEFYLRNYNENHAAYADRRASWTFSNLLNGHLMQHYPIQSQVWASGAEYPNNNFVPIEHEGVAGMILTTPQINTLAHIIQECADYGLWVPVRGVTLWEHNECRRWGAAPTACPSGRIPWDRVMAALEPPLPQPQPNLRRDDMQIIGLEGVAPDAYLLYESHSYLIPDYEMVQDLQAMIYGAEPHEIRQRTWDWLHTVVGFERLA